MMQQRCFCVVTIALLIHVFSRISVVSAQHFPALDPPVEHRSPLLPPTSATQSLVPPSATPTEWTLHKTPDGQHPDAVEQTMMWLINRARQDPTAEGIFLATATEPDIAGGRDFFRVNLTLLQAEFAALLPKPPAAFDVRLYNAAEAHSEALIARDSQDHDGQFDLVRAAGFQFSAARGNVFSYADNGLNAHAAFNIDWGPGDGTGMQPGRGHRQAIMAIDGDYSNVGVAAVPEQDPGTDVGPVVVTQNFGMARTNVTDHFNRFLVGTVWQDRDRNGRYDPGEGFAGIRVTPDSGDFFAVTSAGGGYAIPITAAGTYRVTFAGAGIGPDVTVPVTVAAVSVLLDYRVGSVLTQGDIDGDGRLSPGDAQMVLQYFLSHMTLTASQQSRADVNQDGSITPADALCIFQKLLALPSCLE
jgi:hypothetical protein